MPLTLIVPRLLLSIQVYDPCPLFHGRASRPPTHGASRQYFEEVPRRPGNPKSSNSSLSLSLTFLSGPVGKGDQ
jgi:hypothetical protein